MKKKKIKGIRISIVPDGVESKVKVTIALRGSGSVIRPVRPVRLCRWMVARRHIIRAAKGHFDRPYLIKNGIVSPDSPGSLLNVLAETDLIAYDL